jgi:hypothetical protein
VTSEEFASIAGAAHGISFVTGTLASIQLTTHPQPNQTRLQLIIPIHYGSFCAVDRAVGYRTSRRPSRLSRTLHRLCAHALPSLRIVRFTLGFGTAASGAADRPADGAQRYVGAGRGEQLFGTRTRREGGRTLGSAESLHSSGTGVPNGGQRLGRRLRTGCTVLAVCYD